MKLSFAHHVLQVLSCQFSEKKNGSQGFDGSSTLRFKLNTCLRE